MDINLSITVRPEDRELDGHIKQEVREKIVEELAEQLPNALTLRPYAIAKQLGISNVDTVNAMIREARQKWIIDHADELELQKEWLRRQIEKTQALPITNIFTERDKTNYIITLFNQLNSLTSKFGDGDFKPEDMKFVVWGRIGKNTEKLLEDLDGGTDNTKTRTV